MQFFLFNDTATTEIYTLSLHDALPISVKRAAYEGFSWRWRRGLHLDRSGFAWAALAPKTKAAMRHMLTQIDELPAERYPSRSEEHTSELQSRQYLVCRLLLEKKQR